MNVENEKLALCSKDPLTGWNRTGYCTYKKADGGRHLVCATMTNDFLEYTRSKGNDLTRQSGSFPGLKVGDNWCICAGRYSEAYDAGHAPGIVRAATNKRALKWSAVQKSLGINS